jgi:hypothetical protein
MAVTIEREKLEDGTELTRRIEDGVLESIVQVKQFSSGKRVMKIFDSSGVLAKESHTYGAMLDISISMKYKGGLKIEETYFVKPRLVGRKRYEKARLNYSDMPPADESQADWGEELQQMAREERKLHRRSAVVHQQDKEAAAKLDRFCLELMSSGRSEDAVTWMSQKGSTLGEMDRAKSRRFIMKLNGLNAKKIVACQINAYGEGLGENSGDLVVELPEEPTDRAKLFKFMGRRAQLLGFDPDLDNGQQYGYIKLD